ncbi:MAG TPA: polysaccharide deacetylase family protein [Pilimelia sp.]|nr:polysaccharide deacetylase family protein [Pilimelia sp.]
MTRRTMLFAGLVALAVLLSGQVITAWPGASVASPATQRSRPGGSQPPGPTPRPSVSSPPTTPRPPKPPRKPGGKPGLSRSAYLAALGVKRVTGGGGVALTFDDGPHPTHTPQILALLRAHRVRATFCLVGIEAYRYPRLVAQIVREGHSLCNHSWLHELDLGKRPAAEIRENLARTNAAIRRAVPGARIGYFRHPGGLWTKAAATVSRQLGMVPLDWNVDPSDWDDATAAQISQRVLAQSRTGSVILLHDGGGDRAATVAACRTFIPALKRKYRVVPLR